MSKVDDRAIYKGAQDGEEPICGLKRGANPKLNYFCIKLKNLIVIFFSLSQEAHRIYFLSAVF